MRAQYANEQNWLFRAEFIITASSELDTNRCKFPMRQVDSLANCTQFPAHRLSAASPFTKFE